MDEDPSVSRGLISQGPQAARPPSWTGACRAQRSTMRPHFTRLNTWSCRLSTVWSVRSKRTEPSTCSLTSAPAGQTLPRVATALSRALLVAGSC
jgi:hypothetical protein